jgi:hypothetical protein
MGWKGEAVLFVVCSFGFFWLLETYTTSISTHHPENGKDFAKKVSIPDQPLSQN